MIIRSKSKFVIALSNAPRTCLTLKSDISDLYKHRPFLRQRLQSISVLSSQINLEDNGMLRQAIYRFPSHEVTASAMKVIAADKSKKSSPTVLSKVTVSAVSDTSSRCQNLGGNTKVSENASKALEVQKSPPTVLCGVTVSAVKANSSWHTQKIIFIESE